MLMRERLPPLEGVCIPTRTSLHRITLHSTFSPSLGLLDDMPSLDLDIDGELRAPDHGTVRAEQGVGWCTSVCA